MLQAVLNTKVYLGGAPFDKNGDDTYQLQGWSEKAQLESINLLCDEGDATQISMDIIDRDAEAITARLLHSEVIDRRTIKVYDEPIRLLGSKKGRLYIRLTALDGEQQNHCKAVFKGSIIP